VAGKYRSLLYCCSTFELEYVMPRKKTVDPLVSVLDFFELETEQSCKIAQRIVARIVDRRFPPAPKVAKPVVRRRRKPSTPAEMVALAERQLAGTSAPKPRKRRMRAGSQPPVNEATPIVPAVDAGT